VHAVAGFPDPLVGWYPFARRAALRIARTRMPDVIYASSPGPTGLLVAHSVAGRLHVPWVAEFRDLWMDHPALGWTGWRRRLGEWLERRTLGTAAAMVTVSEPWAELLRRKFGKPVVVVTNGFDPEDFPRREARGEGRGARDEGLRLVHTGILDGSSRDPSPLFAAIALLNRDRGPGTADRQSKLRVAFYGPDEALSVAGRLASRYGVAANVELIPSVPYRESLRAQSEADVLLMLLWKAATGSEAKAGWHSGKLFEYMGARRPILAVGTAGDAAELIRARRLGPVLSDPSEIARQLEEWMAVKSRGGTIAPPPEGAAAGFTREEQARNLEKVLLAVVSGGIDN
jgi:glycosyltransferase involved in cell wall biosynthesis